jgi:guanylate kinase
VNKFLLLLGPSGVGKSSIIQELKNTDERFIYISPYTTRSLRDGETDKIFVSDDVMNDMKSRGEFLTINEIYGVRYATPIKPIINALDTGKFPVLDWPIQKIDLLTKSFPGRLYVVYISPPSLGELRVRMNKDYRDIDGSRLDSATKELEQFWNGKYDEFCDLKIVSRTGLLPKITKQIYSKYLESMNKDPMETLGE